MRTSPNADSCSTPEYSTFFPSQEILAFLYREGPYFNAPSLSPTSLRLVVTTVRLRPLSCVGRYLIRGRGVRPVSLATLSGKKQWASSILSQNIQILLVVWVMNHFDHAFRLTDLFLTPPRPIMHRFCHFTIFYAASLIPDSLILPSIRHFPEL